jgi:hypothetical protein
MTLTLPQAIIIIFSLGIMLGCAFGYLIGAAHMKVKGHG